MIYSTNINRILDQSYFTFNAGDEQRDRGNELRVASARVNDAQCARDLLEMVSQLDELEAQLERVRRSTSASNWPLAEQHVRLARVLDSYGRYGSGSLDGLSRAIGSYNQCISTSLLRS